MTDATPHTEDSDGAVERHTDELDETGDDRTAYDVPSNETPVECTYCGRPFESDALLALHRGQVHADVITDDERAAYDSAREAESGQLRRFRLKALAALVVIYFGFLMVYALV